jgi:hypothetical protein
MEDELEKEVIDKEKKDYSKWRKEFFKNESLEDLSNKAMESWRGKFEN